MSVFDALTQDGNFPTPKEEIINENANMEVNFVNTARRAVNKAVLSLDFENKTDRRVNMVIMAVFLKDSAGLKEEDIVGVQKYLFTRRGGYLKLNMSSDVDVNKKFKTNCGIFEDDLIRLKLRGVRKDENSELVRIHNPPEDASITAIEKALEKFGRMETRVTDERFWDNMPLFANKPNGNWIARMNCNDKTKVLESIVIRDAKTMLV